MALYVHPRAPRWFQYCDPSGTLSCQLCGVVLLARPGRASESLLMTIIWEWGNTPTGGMERDRPFCSQTCRDLQLQADLKDERDALVALGFDPDDPLAPWLKRDSVNTDTRLNPEDDTFMNNPLAREDAERNS